MRVSGNAPRARLELRVRDTGPWQVLEGLARGLEASRVNPLLTQFGKRRLTLVRRDSQLADVHGWDALFPAQRKAVAACCSPGLQLVWGPPGTAETLVIAAAVSRLASFGQRVLLVSSTNIAVDTALREALRILEPGGEGQAVRVGHIDLPELAADGRVRLDRLVESRQAEQQARVDSLAGQLEDLTSAGQASRRGGKAAGRVRRGFLRAGRHTRHQPAPPRTSDWRASAMRRRALMAPEPSYFFGSSRCFRWPAARRLTARQRYQANLATVDAALGARPESSRMTRARRPGMKGRLTANRTDLANELARAAAVRRQAVTAAKQAGADPAPPSRRTPRRRPLPPSMPAESSPK